MRRLAALPLVVSAGCGHGTAPAAPPAAPVLIAGSFEPGRGPDGNSVILDAPRGLVVVDTGRHAAHQQRLLAAARDAGKPIAAIVNTHWHLDHTGGNAELRAVYPDAEIVATPAIDGALTGFFPGSRADAEAFVASGQATVAQVAEIEADFAAVDAPGSLRPTRPITASSRVELAGRSLDLRVAPLAATEADLWIVDEASRTVIAGDLVVAPVPFLDTACPRGWQAALGEIAATDFDRLIPGHGAPMTAREFATWRAAFDALLACAGSDAPADDCVAGWLRDAAPFIDDGDAPRIEGMLGYYLAERLRSAEATARFCAPLS